ncbi:MAG: MerR family transcriptional regulator [Alphaproteobacteria bacterium]
MDGNGADGQSSLFPASARRGKSPSAYRTISEVAEELDLPQHVLRFWETKFPVLSPLKRGGGRRYYRPEDVELLRRIKTLLHAEGYTIKCAQRVLRDPGARGGEDEGDEEEDGTADEVRLELAAVLAELRALRALLDDTVDPAGDGVLGDDRASRAEDPTRADDE